MLLKNKTAIVTGGRQGIGKGIVLALAQEGCDVVVSDIVLEDCGKVVKEIEKIGVKGLAVKCDVSKKEEVDN
ncbi:MAG: SDR family NAD(P)-dependent oxidoreductase, partial [bacterium]|nr:SDR family NAD(P)-dependent oxidoreductase [bacterium]